MSMLDTPARAERDGDITEQVWAATKRSDTGVVPTVDDALWAAAAPNDSPPAPPLTVLPPRPVPGAPPPARRPIGKVSRDDVLTVIGALVSSLSIALLTFGRLTALHGRFGFVVFWFAMFLVIYALLVSITEPRPAVVDRVMAALMTSAAAVAIGALLWVVGSTVWRGRNALWRSNLYTEDMGVTGPLDPLTAGGIKHAIVGTLIIMAISLVLTVPLALACAVYLTETRGPISEFVRSVVTAMTALPSVVAGLFIFATWVVVLGFARSGLAAALALSLMMLPIIIRSADVVLRLVPGNLREASAALGASQWRTVWFVVLPTARSGLTTSVILGVARGIGETAPVLLVSGSTARLNVNPRENAMMSLPLATFEFVRSPQPALVARGFATAAVLMIVVLVLFMIARLLGGRPAGRQSTRQARRAVARSVKVLARIEVPPASTNDSAAEMLGPNGATP